MYYYLICEPQIMTTMEKQTNHDEIDLVELLVKTVLLIKRNLIQIIIFFVVGTGLGYAYASLAPKVYESKMLVSSEILTESFSEKLFQNLQNLINEKNDPLIASNLGLTAEETKALSKLKIESALKDKPPSEDDKKFFLITAELTDQSILPKLQSGLINFFQKNDYVKLRVDAKRKMHQEVIAKIDEEIESLEKFKKEIVDGSFFSRTKGDVMFDPTEVNSKIVGLTQEKESLKEKLALVNSVEVIEGFTHFNKPVWPKKSVSLAAGSTMGLFLVGILIAFKSIRKLVRYAEKHPSQKPEF